MGIEYGRAVVGIRDFFDASRAPTGMAVISIELVVLIGAEPSAKDSLFGRP